RTWGNPAAADLGVIQCSAGFKIGSLPPGNDSVMDDQTVRTAGSACRGGIFLVRSGQPKDSIKKRIPHSPIRQENGTKPQVVYEFPLSFSSRHHRASSGSSNTSLISCFSSTAGGEPRSDLPEVSLTK